MSPRRRRRVLGREPLPVGVDEEVEQRVTEELRTARPTLRVVPAEADEEPSGPRATHPEPLPSEDADGPELHEPELHEMVRAELQRILLERQDVLERLAMGAPPRAKAPPARRLEPSADARAPEAAEAPQVATPEEAQVELTPATAGPVNGDAMLETPAWMTDLPPQSTDERLLRMQQEIERYKRRVTKLCGSLERAEEALRKISVAGPEAGGIPSVFRTVQGLSRDDEHFHMKHDALSKIFEANVALQKGSSVA